MFRFEELEVWKLAVAYGKDCYRIAGTFPKHEQYGLADQLAGQGFQLQITLPKDQLAHPATFSGISVLQSLPPLRR